MQHQSAHTRQLWVKSSILQPQILSTLCSHRKCAAARWSASTLLDVEVTGILTAHPTGSDFWSGAAGLRLDIWQGNYNTRLIRIQLTNYRILRCSKKQHQFHVQCHKVCMAQLVVTVPYQQLQRQKSILKLFSFPLNFISNALSVFPSSIRLFIHSPADGFSSCYWGFSLNHLPCFFCHSHLPPFIPLGCGHDWWQGWTHDGPETWERLRSSWIPPRRADLWWLSKPLLVSCSLSKQSSFWKGGGWGIPLVLGNVRLKSTLFLNKDLLWDIPKNSHSKADPLSPHHTVLEAGGDGWNEVLDMGKAALAHAPWPIHQEHNVCLHHCPACWESEREKKEKSQSKLNPFILKLTSR